MRDSILKVVVYNSFPKNVTYHISIYLYLSIYISIYMYIVAYIAARIYRGWHESQECAIFKLR